MNAQHPYRRLAILALSLSTLVGCADALDEPAGSPEAALGSGPEVEVVVEEPSPGRVGDAPFYEELPVVAEPAVERQRDKLESFPGQGVIMASTVTLPPAPTADATCSDHEPVRSLTAAQIEAQRIVVVEDILEQAREVCADGAFVLRPRRVEEGSTYVSVMGGCDPEPVAEIYSAVAELHYHCLDRLAEVDPQKVPELSAVDYAPLYDRIWLHAESETAPIRVEPVEDSCEEIDCCLDAGAGRGYCELREG